MNKFVSLAIGIGLLALTLGLLATGSTTASPNVQTCNVLGDYGTIQDAVDDVTCDPIDVDAGTFVENVTINRSVTIQGQGIAETTIEGGEAGSVFTINPGITVTIENLQVTGGRSSQGGGIHNTGSSLTINSSAVVSNTAFGTNLGGSGGGIYSFGSSSKLTITDSLLSGNQAGERGGAVYCGGHLTILNSVISNNHASSEGGGIATALGLITPIDEPSLILDGVIVERNTARYAAGIKLGCNSVLIRESTISANVAADDTGGGGVAEGCGQGKMRILRSTIRDNHAGGSAAIYFSGERLEVINSTISGNTASGSAAAIYTCCNNVRAILRNTTVTGNVGASRGALLGWLTLANTLVAWNGPTNCEGQITSQGHNLASDFSCNLFLSSDLQGVNANIGPLQDNGGPTDTHALLKGSPAIDAGDDAVCPGTDQRGEPRPRDSDGDGVAICDIGAYEADESIAGLTATSSSPTFIGQMTTFSATVTAGSNVDFYWDFGDTFTATGPVATHTYTAINEYIVTVTATNPVSFEKQEMNVHVVPVTMFLPVVLRP